jgi:ADP-heptose:LPS heptosyltransferase
MARRAGSDVRRICVFARLGLTGLGDLIMRTGLFQVIRRAFPEASVTLVIGSNLAADFAEFLALHCPIDDVVTCPPCAAGPPDDSPEWATVRAELQGRDFDLCLVDAGSFFLHAGFAKRIGIPVRVGVRQGHPEEGDLTSCAPLVARRGGDPDLADFVAAYAQALGLPPIDPADAVGTVPFEPEGEPPATARPRVVMHVGGGRHWNRRWPLPNYVEFCNRLLAERGGSIVLVGPQEERENAAIIAGVDPAVRGRIRSLGAASIARTATVTAGSDLFVGSDSAPMHLAVGVGIPTVALYGPADAFLFWEHVYPRHHLIGRRWPCHLTPHDWPAREEATCEHRCRYRVSPGGSSYPACIADITVDEVIDVTGSVLDTVVVGEV